MNVSPIGVLERRGPDELALFAMAENHKTRDIPNTEAMCRILIRESNCFMISQHILLQGSIAALKIGIVTFHDF